MRVALIGLALGIASSASASPPLSLAGFADGIHHWQNAHHTRDYPRLAADDVHAIAENLLLHQRANGGWRENEDPRRILSTAETEQLLRDREKTDTSFDNRNTWPQIEFLAGTYGLTGDQRYRDAALRGLDFLFSAQHASGGFPHSFPSRENYRAHLTFADDILPDLLHLLRRVARREAPFDFVDPARVQRAAEAVARGMRSFCACKSVRTACERSGPGNTITRPSNPSVRAASNCRDSSAARASRSCVTS